MLRISRFTLIVAIGLLIGSPIFAKGGMFGKQENIHKIQDVQLKGANGESLFLGYKTSGYFVFGGVYLKDDGYVFGVVDEPNTFYPFPAEEELKPLQAAGLVPETLPEYTIPWVDYLFGYSLWIILVAVGIYTWGKEKLFGLEEGVDDGREEVNVSQEDDKEDKLVR